MDNGYQQGGGPPHMVGYYQGMPGYSQQAQNPVNPSSSPSQRQSSSISIWAGDLDAYMDENFLRQAVTASGWGNDITRIKVVRDHYSGMHAGYGFLDAASPEAAERVIATGSGMPIPGTNRCWRLNMGRNAAVPSVSNAGTEINIYVGNLEPSVTDYQLMTAFRPRYSSVRHAKVVCNEYGQSRGFGFVRFANPTDAERAVSEMQGFEFNGKAIRLSPATGRARGGNRGGGGGGGGPHGGFGGGHGGHHGGHHHGSATNKRPRQLMSPDDPNNTTIFIGGTGPHINEDLLWREFTVFGELEAVRVPVNKTGFAFVRFKNRECAQRAKDELSGTHLISLNPNKPVRIEWAAEQIAITKPPPVASQMSNSSMMYSGSGNSQPYDPQYNPPYNANHSNQDMSPPGNNMSNHGFNAYQPSSNQNQPSNNPPNSAGPGTIGQPTAPNGMKPDDKSPSAGDLAGQAPSGKDNGPGKNDTMSVSGAGETEPPSKRAAVGRPEYASARGDANGKKDSLGDIKPDGTAEDSPAMQFSWLNASSTQPTSSQQ